MPTPLSTWWSIWPLRTSNKIIRRQRRQRTAKLQTWSSWASSGCTIWCKNHHPTTHPPTVMTRVWWRQRPRAKYWWKTRYQARGRKKDKKGCRHWHRSQTPSTSPSRSLRRYRSKSCASISGSRIPDKRDINPTNCPYCKEFGGYGLAHASPKSVPHTKFNYNKKWKGWRPEWVCKNISVAYKEHGDCD